MSQKVVIAPTKFKQQNAYTSALLHFTCTATQSQKTFIHTKQENKSTF